MATINDAFIALSGLGFETAGKVCFGTWNNYAILLRQGTGKNLFATFAVRLPKVMFDGRKELFREVKENSGNKLKPAGITKTSISFSIPIGKAENLSGFLSTSLKILTEALRNAGVAPADTCAATGADRPDSLCLMTKDNVQSFQPVCAAAIRDKDVMTREKAEENQENGSYLMGFVGTLLGMLVGLIPNLLSIIFASTIWSLLFALVPLCAMFGYKLFKGKMSKGSIVIVIVLCLFGVLLIPLFEITITLIREYGLALSDALGWATTLMLEPDVLSEISGELLQLLLFMALGIFIAWRYMSGSTNSSQVSGTEAQLATLRPNPRYAQDGETEQPV